MPTKREREYYRMGFQDGQRASTSRPIDWVPLEERREPKTYDWGAPQLTGEVFIKPKKRKLSAWNKYVKANANKPRFRLRSGKLNLKKMGVAFRKTPQGKKKRR